MSKNILTAILIMFTLNVNAHDWLGAEKENYAFEGLYFGINIGQAIYDVSGGGFLDVENNELITVVSSDLDESVTSLSLTLGYQLNSNFSVEGGYIKFGEASDEVVVTVVELFFGYASTVVKTDGLFLDIKGQVPINEVFSLYGKLGILKWEADFSTSSSVPELNMDNTFTSSEDDTDPFYGIGGSFLLDNNENYSIALNIEYTLYKLDTIDVDVFSVGMQFGF